MEYIVFLCEDTVVKYAKITRYHTVVFNQPLLGINYEC